MFKIGVRNICFNLMTRLFRVVLFLFVNSRMCDTSTFSKIIFLNSKLLNFSSYRVTVGRTEVYVINTSPLSQPRLFQDSTTPTGKDIYIRQWIQRLHRCMEYAGAYFEKE